jgi:carbonic anhydrase/acetyltransferase-like protein (isoleucine patch superfamily)
MLLKIGSHRPSVDPSAVIAPNAALVGDVRIGARCMIGYGASLIAEGQPITLGEQVIVRDNAVIRSAGKYPVGLLGHRDTGIPPRRRSQTGGGPRQCVDGCDNRRPTGGKLW